MSWRIAVDSPEEREDWPYWVGRQYWRGLEDAYIGNPRDPMYDQIQLYQDGYTAGKEECRIHDVEYRMDEEVRSADDLDNTQEPSSLD